MIDRRGFITGLISALAAPAIVHAGNLMPIKAVRTDLLMGYIDGVPIYRDPIDWEEMERMTRELFLPRIHTQLWKEPPLHILRDSDGEDISKLFL